MTTNIKVNAHCADDKEVHIKYADPHGQQKAIIQNGEKFETVVYDDLSCTIREVEKPSIDVEPENGDGQTRPPPDKN